MASSTAPPASPKGGNQHETMVQALQSPAGGKPDEHEAGGEKTRIERDIAAVYVQLALQRPEHSTQPVQQVAQHAECRVEQNCRPVAPQRRNPLR